MAREAGQNQADSPEVQAEAGQVEGAEASLEEVPEAEASASHFLLQVYSRAKSGYKKHRLPVWVSVCYSSFLACVLLFNPPLVGFQA